MAYHHIVAKLGSKDELRVLFADLSLAELRQRFIVPYEQSKSFFCGNELIAPNDLRSLQIVRTQQAEAIEREQMNKADLARIDELNRSSDGVVIMSLGGGYDPEDIAQAGEDVTHTFIKGPPGFKAGRWTMTRKVLAWVAGIIAAVIAAGAIKWLGWV